MSAATKSPEWEAKVKDAALRFSRSEAVKEFFGFTGAPSQWEKVISGWNESHLDDFMLIIHEEEELRKDLSMQIKRKKKVNDTRLLQRFEQIKMTTPADQK